MSAAEKTLRDLEVTVRIRGNETWRESETEYGRTKYVWKKREGVEIVNLGADFDSAETVAAVLRGIADRIAPQPAAPSQGAES